MPGGKYQTSFVRISSREKEPVYFNHGSAGGYFCLQGSFRYVLLRHQRRPPSSVKTLSTGNLLSFPQIYEPFFIDNSNTALIGSVDTGLFRIRYEYVNDTPILLKKPFFFAMAFVLCTRTAKGYIWAGSRFNGARIVFARWKSWTFSPAYRPFCLGLTSDRIVSIAEDRNGSIWQLLPGPW